MAGFVLIGIIFGLHFLVFQCEGKVSLKSGEATRCAQIGDTVEIEWKFDATVSNPFLRVWQFQGKTIASITNDGNVTYLTSILPRFKAEKPAKLILNNVDSTYEGTYSFTASPETSPLKVEVNFTIAAKPTVTISCDTPYTCLCKTENGKPPADVTWENDGGQIGGIGVEQNTLNLSTINNPTIGNYRCVAESCNLNSSDSVMLSTPDKPSLTFSPKEAVVSKPFTVTCEAEAQPKARYIIKHNGTQRFEGVGNKYTIDEVKKNDAGTYECIAINAFGNNSISAFLSVAVGNGDADESSDGLGGGAIAGIIIGVLVLVVIIIAVVWWLKFKNKGEENRRVENEYDVVEPHRGGRNEPANQPHEYAVLEKPEGPTYASLDQDALKKKNTSSQRSTEEPTQYADISFNV